MAVTVITKSAGVIPRLCQLLKAGKVVAAPTETAYGLLADATNPKAVREIVRLKGRRETKPMPLVAASLSMVKRYCQMNALESKLAHRFWPGPLTLVLVSKRRLPTGIVAPNGTVGIRVPGSVWLRRLSAAFGRPLTATSANVASGATPYSAIAVRRALAARGLQYMVDCGLLRQRLTSTVVQVRSGQLKIFREGAISRARLERMLRS